MKKLVGVVMLTVMLLVAGCGKDDYPPVPINEEIDRCETCNMAIKDDAYATQIITKEGRSLKFDDLGCLVEWRVEHGTDTIAATYVRDHSSLEWIKYDKAYYVYDASIQTPMAYGVISFESEKAANDYISEHGVGALMDAEALAAHSWEVNQEMMGTHGHGDGHGHEHSDADAHNNDASHDADAHGDSEAAHGEAGHEAGAHEAGVHEAGAHEAGAHEAGHDDAAHEADEHEGHTGEASHEAKAHDA